jgi:hypothetical protein
MQKKPKVKVDTKLNPQPEPPSPTSKLERVGLNPQPDPPSPASKLQKVGLNPQPDPPSPADELQRVGLNPQPEPPSPARSGKLKVIKIVSLLGAIGLGFAGFYFIATSLLPALEALQIAPPISDAAILAQAAVNSALVPTLVTLIPAGALLVIGIAVKAH